ncbi:MAG: hypothetical protein CSA18_03455 [Deltaproteobacteria bacterium]|nr:MAG: hypothetical protein CSA18_03455 [Deltaproteobacteria bacterium]
MQDSDYIKRDKFDFEIGYLIASPCRKCEKRDSLPLCHKKCRFLDLVQKKIAGGISSFRNK